MKSECSNEFSFRLCYLKDLLLTLNFYYYVYYVRFNNQDEVRDNPAFKP